MDMLTCYFDDETAVLMECCTFDRESDTEPDDCISCGEMCEEMGGECSKCPIQKAFNKLATYELLEQKLTEKYKSNISLNQLVEHFLGAIFGDTPRTGFRVLTDKEAEEWDKHKQIIADEREDI